jgi:hypothetical protein
VLWEIWKARLKNHFHNLLQLVQKTAADIWCKIRNYRKLEWAALKKKQLAKTLPSDKVLYLFCKEFGYDPEVVSFSDGVLTVALTPSIGVLALLNACTNRF